MPEADEGGAGEEEEEEEAEEHEEKDEGAADSPDPEEPVPPEKDLVEHVTLNLGPPHCDERSVPVRIADGLDQWALRALSDDCYWMLKDLASADSPADADADADGGGEVGGPPAPPQSANLPMVIVQTDDGWELRIAEPAEEPEEGDGAAAEGEGEGGDDDGSGGGGGDDDDAGSAGGGGDDDEVAGAEEAAAAAAAEAAAAAAAGSIACDLLAIVVSQSPQCAVALLGSGRGVRLDGAVAFCAATVGPAALSYNASLLRTVQETREAAGAAGGGVDGGLYRVSFDGLFTAAGDDAAAFRDGVARGWQAAGLEPDALPRPAALRSPGDVHALHSVLTRCSEQGLRRLARAREGDGDGDGDGDAEDDDGARGASAAAAPPPRLPSYLADVLLALRSAKEKGHPRSLRVACEGDDAVSGVYRRRGEEGGKPCYWKGDPVSTSVSHVLYFTDRYGWRLRRGETVLYMCRGTVSELPLQPRNWADMERTGTSALVFLTPTCVEKAAPRLKALHKPDAVFASSYGDGPSPSLELRFSDLLLYTYMLAYNEGAASSFVALLAAKAASLQRQAATAPTGWPHFVYMSLALAPPQAALRVVAAAPAAAMLRPLGRVPLRPFVARCVPKLGQDVADALAGRCCTAVLEAAGGLPPDSAFVERCAAKAEARREAEAVLEGGGGGGGGEAAVADALAAIAEKSGCVYDEGFLRLAALAGNVAAVDYLLHVCGVPPMVRGHECQEARPLMPYCLEEKLVGVVEFLLARGHNLNTVWDGGRVGGVFPWVHSFFCVTHTHTHTHTHRSAVSGTYRHTTHQRTATNFSLCGSQRKMPGKATRQRDTACCGLLLSASPESWQPHNHTLV